MNHARIGVQGQGQFPMTQTQYDAKALATNLEAMIDGHGLGVVLAAIREICYEKADHIAVTYQDVALAKRWAANGLKVNSAAQEVRI